MEYFKNDLSLPCSGLKVMTKSKTNFCLMADSYCNVSVYSAESVT